MRIRPHKEVCAQIFQHAPCVSGVLDKVPARYLVDLTFARDKGAPLLASFRDDVFPVFKDLECFAQGDAGDAERFRKPPFGGELLAWLKLTQVDLTPEELHCGSMERLLLQLSSRPEHLRSP
ncbi:hypothetical protein AJ87_41895 [Rhizobium yanglingense]|nr:hypothetical protein AJ87_41895 [Rhizobium yanglingense]